MAEEIREKWHNSANFWKGAAITTALTCMLSQCGPSSCNKACNTVESYLKSPIVETKKATKKKDTKKLPVKKKDQRREEKKVTSIPITQQDLYKNIILDYGTKENKGKRILFTPSYGTLEATRDNFDYLGRAKENSLLHVGYRHKTIDSKVGSKLGPFELLNSIEGNNNGEHTLIQILNDGYCIKITPDEARYTEGFDRDVNDAGIKYLKDTLDKNNKTITFVRTEENGLVALLGNITPDMITSQGNVINVGQCEQPQQTQGYVTQGYPYNQPIIREKQRSGAAPFTQPRINPQVTNRPRGGSLQRR